MDCSSFISYFCEQEIFLRSLKRLKQNLSQPNKKLFLCSHIPKYTGNVAITLKFALLSNLKNALKLSKYDFT